MARYRQKSESDLVWNRIRRAITRELDTKIMDAREEALNTLLTKAFDEYCKAIGHGELPEIESKYSNLARTIVRDNLRIPDMVDSDAEVE